MTGNTGMFNTQAVTQFRSEAAKAEKEIEKLGYTADQAHIMSRLLDVNDNTEDGPLTQARRSMEQSYNMQAQAQQQLNATVRKHTKDLTKQANAAAKVAGATQKVYTENARTEQQLKDNLSILEEQKSKLDPQSDKWTEIRDKIEKTKDHLERIKLTGLPVDSLAAMRNELQKVNQQMETLSTNTKEFADAAAKANSLNAKISDATAEPGTSSSDKSLAGYQKKIQELNAELSKFTEPFSADDVKRIEQINQEIKACEDSVQRLRKAFEQPPVAGSINEAAKSMQEYDQKIQNAATDAERAALGVERMKAANLLADKSAAASGVDSKMINREKRSDNNTDLQKKTETASYAQEQAARIQQQVELGVMGADEAKAELNEINGVLKEIGAEPIEIDVKSNKLKKTLRDVNYAAEAVGSLGQAASTLGQAFETPELNVAGIIAQTIANIALSTSEAIMQSTAMGPWGWIAFSMAAMAEMAAMIAQIHSVTGYASGGIVEGSSYSGDKINARLNSGEMVLNRRQQGHLFDALDSGRVGGGGVTEVEWRLRGSDLYGSVKNYSKTTARAGRRTGIR
jgi:DNA repair exonuclease SbcCD ATPase subunit